jgi:predicted molibdopterin-dependent oxidoreductase YjgC
VSAPPVPSSADPGGPQFRRLKSRDSTIIHFTIDDAPAEARAGDLLMTAILLHRPSLRRFEFGEGERAGFCFMAACQDCWVSLVNGQRVRACSTLVTEGMAVVTGTGHG